MSKSPNMTTIEDPLRLSLEAVPASVGQARTAVAELGEQLGMVDPTLGDLKTVVTEACSNVVQHAYPHSAGTFTLSVNHREGELIVIVRDFGIGLSAAAPGARESLHLGLGLIALLALSHQISEPASGGTEVRIVIRLQPQQD
jgi:anti-sigma regulatory factor (Ser/Thr protein kinase)